MHQHIDVFCDFIARKRTLLNQRIQFDSTAQIDDLQL